MLPILAFISGKRGNASLVRRLVTRNIQLFYFFCCGEANQFSTDLPVYPAFKDVQSLKCITCAILPREGGGGVL